MDIASLNIKVTQTGVNEAATGLNRVGKEAQGAATNVDRFENSTRKGSQGASAFSSAVQGLSSALSATAIITATIQFAKLGDEWLMIEARVRNSTQSIQEAGYALDELIGISQRTGASLDTTLSIFQRISFVREEINATADDMLQFVDTVSMLGVISGASNESLKAGLTQLGQSLSSDIVRAEEFNSIMENVPAVGKAIADQFGVTTGELRKMVIEGEVLSSDVFAAILNSTDEVATKFETIPKTATLAFQGLILQIKETVGGINEATSGTQVFAAGLYAVTKIIEGMGITVEIMANSFNMFFDILIESIISLVTRAFDFIEARINDVIGLLNYIPGVEISKSTLTRDVLGFNTEDLQQSGKWNKQDNIKSLEKSYAKAGDFLGMGEAEEKRATTTREISKNYSDIVKSLKDGNAEEDKAAKKLNDTISNLKFRNEQIVRGQKEQDLYNQLRSANVDIDSAAGREISNLVDEYNRLKVATEQTKRVTDALGDAFGKAFEDAIVGAGSFGEAMKGLVDDIQRLLIQETITGPLKNLITGGGSGGGGGFLGSLIGGIGSFFGGGGGPSFDDAYSVFPSFDVGTNNVPNDMLANIHKGEMIIPAFEADQIRNGGMGNQVVYNIDARGADAGVEERIMAALKSVDRSVESRAINAVDTQFKRNPSFGKR